MSAIDTSPYNDMTHSVVAVEFEPRRREFVDPVGGVAYVKWDVVEQQEFVTDVSEIGKKVSEARVLYQSQYISLITRYVEALT